MNGTNWQTIILSVFASTGGVAIFVKSIHAYLELRVKNAHAREMQKLEADRDARREETKNEKAENVWLRKQFDELCDRFERLEERHEEKLLRYEMRIASLEKTKAEDTEKRHTIANEANAAKLGLNDANNQIKAQNQQMAQLQSRISELESDKARLHREVASLENQIQAIRQVQAAAADNARHNHPRI